MSGKEAIKSEASSSAIAAELGSDTSGVSILEGIAARKENLAHPVPVTSSEGQAAADAFFRMSARRFVTGHGVVEVVAFGADHPGASASGARAFYERLGFIPAESAAPGPEGGSRQVYRKTVTAPDRHVS